MGKENVSAQQPTFWAVMCSSGLYQDNQGSSLREMGIRLIIYIDDILLVAESETLLKDHIAGIHYLLENILNFPNSLLEPMKAIDFLGFHLDSTAMELKLPGDKIKSLRERERQGGSWQPTAYRPWTYSVYWAE